MSKHKKKDLKSGADKQGPKSDKAAKKALAGALSEKPAVIAAPVTPSPVELAKPVADLPAAPKPSAAKPRVTAKTSMAPKVPKITKAKSVSYSTDDIALQAYFISEKRRARGLPGDEHQDWIEAERQLRTEAAKPARTKKTA